MLSQSEDSSSSIRQETDSISTEFNCLEGEDDPFINSLWGIHKTLDALRGNMNKQQLDSGDTVEESSDVEETVLPPTYIVLQVSSDIPEKTLLWLIDKIRGKKRDGGGELIVMKQLCNPEDGYVLHLSASKIKFLEVAEDMELIKQDRNGQMREFTVAQLEDFLPEDMHVEDLLTMAERQNIVRHELENIRALAEDDHIPGYPTYTLYEGQSIFQVLQMYEIVTKMFPLHDDETLKKLGRSWYMSVFKKQPFEEIRLYFGEAIALYFHFLSFYTSALLVPVVLGFLQLLVSTETVPFFCAFNMVSVILFLEIWKRNGNELAFKWGTIGMTSMDEPRPNFRGAMGIDAITGKIQPQAPRYMTYIKMYAVSIPIVLMCMVGAFIVMLFSFWAEDYIKQSDEETQRYIMLPSVIYSIVVFIMNTYYRRLATFLTEWENHRTQSQYERHRVTKLVLFEFVNNFLSLFYIAFIIRDMDMLKSQLQTMLIISQAINNLQETVMPLAYRYYIMKVLRLKQKLLEKPSPSNQPKVFRDNMLVPKQPLSNINIPTIQPDDLRIKQAMEEAEMEAYEGTYDDYLELFIQFGYVFLFSSVYPVAAFWALLNNVVEIRADAFKLCKVFQRPMSRKVKDIGAWQRAFEVVGALSIFTNCGLLYLSPQIRRRAQDFSEVQWLLLFVFLEHLLLGIRYLLHIAISDKPEWVRVALAKRNHESKQALKFERAQKNRRLLTRKFKTVHGRHAH
ncbi:anoctamin-10 isoform X2 [Anoplophora glabripennis]|nr:anoctamin-10 isoform X2 [Anoplophora glabripennis]